VGRVDAVELAAIERAADEWAGPRNTLRSASDRADTPFEPRLGTPDGSPFCLSRGSPRRHNRAHLSVISVGKGYLGAEGASEAVANDDARWIRRANHCLSMAMTAGSTSATAGIPTVTNATNTIAK
jgi:hypothetical protein